MFMMVRRFLPIRLNLTALLVLSFVLFTQCSPAEWDNKAAGISDAWPGNTDRIEFLWENSRAHNEVFDEGNQQHRLFRGLLHGRARFGPNYQLELARGYFRPDDVDDSLLRACKKSHQLAVEAVIRPETLKQSGPARIISFSSGTGSRNFTLGQEKDKLILRLRTPKTGVNGTNPEHTLCKVKAGHNQHILLTYRPGRLVAYLDGRQVFSSERNWGNFSNWEPQHLLLGDEHGGDRDWSGSLEGIAIYSRFIPNKEAERHYELYADRLKDRKSPDRMVVEARLIETTRTPPVDRLGTYRRCLAEYVYDVKKVVKGNLKANKIIVAHWAIMDLKVLPDKRSKDAIYQLTIEPWEQHPQLGGELIETYLGEADLPVFYDVAMTVTQKQAPAPPRIHLRVNAGGPAIGRPGDPDYWESDSKYVKGGASFSFKGKHDVSKVKKPAPQGVYQTVRHRDHKYNFPKLPDGKYTVRFHFTDGYKNHNRAMDYTVEDVKIIDHFSIVRAAGGTMKAVVVEATVMVSDNNGLQIACKRDRGNDVFEAGVEIISGGGELTKPKAARRKDDPRFGRKVPEDLDWLRSLCGDGALAYQAGGRLHLVELSKGKVEVIGRGALPEFSPDSSKLVWIDGSTLRGRMRKGDKTVHTIAKRVERDAGVHWLGNDAVLAVVREGKKKRWFKFSLTGERERMRKLDRLGFGERETDVKLCKDGVWVYVSGRNWKTSDGKKGHIGGGCACSFSPDGLSITALQGDHRSCKLNAIGKGGYKGELRWRYKGKFDNHRWSSNDERFIVCVEETENVMVVVQRGTNRATRMGQRHKDKKSGEMYGDFTRGGGRGAPWPKKR